MSRIFFASVLFVMTLTGFGKVDTTEAAEPAIRAVRGSDQDQGRLVRVQMGHRPRSTAVAGVRG